MVRSGQDGHVWRYQGTRKTQQDMVLVPSAHLVCYLSLLGIASLGLDDKVAKRTETVQAVPTTVHPGPGLGPLPTQQRTLGSSAPRPVWLKAIVEVSNVSPGDSELIDCLLGKIHVPHNWKCKQK